MNALAATAAAWAAGLNPAMIVRALTTFKTDIATAPGRFNIFELAGVQVIVDYGHNVAALEALGKAVQALESRHTVMAFTLPGDRRDEDLIESTTATIAYVDEYVIYDSEDLRGRAPDEVARLIACHLPPDVPRELSTGQRNGIWQAWQRVQPGDRLIIICDEVGEAVEVLHTLAESISEDAACLNPLMPDAEDLPHREPVGFPALTGLPVPNGKKNAH
jgi:cyanophycin synthetase